MIFKTGLMKFRLNRNIFHRSFRQIHLSQGRNTYDDVNYKKLTSITEKVGFIGDGNMARAICRGMIKKGLLDINSVFVSSPYEKNLEKWKLIGCNVTTDNGVVAASTDVVVLAIKPDMLEVVCKRLQEGSSAKAIKNKLFLSILAGVKLSKLEKLLKPFEGSRVIRLMPNTPMMVGAGCTAYSPGTNVTDYDISVVRAILDSTGICQRVPESMINAANAMSGGGPAFVYLMIEAMSDGAVRMGLHRDMATLFAAQTFLGAAKMVMEADRHPGHLKDSVCSAGGTTIAGLFELEKAGVRGAIMSAIEASKKRADEMGENQ